MNNGIVVFSAILKYIWENRFLVHLLSVFKVKPIDWVGETPFGQTPFGLGNTGGDIKGKNKSNSVRDMDDRVSYYNADKYLKTKKNEDW